MDLLNHLPELLQVLFLAVLQGVTELFPVSSLGQSIIIPGLFGWGNLLTSETFVPILVMLHLGTATALLTFFWRDWVELIAAFFKTAFAGRLDAHPQGKTIWLIIVGTIPVGLAGLLLNGPIKAIFFSSQWPVIPAAFLCLNGTILFAGEYLRRRSEPDVTRPLQAGAGVQAHPAAHLPSGDAHRRGAGVRADSRHLAVGYRDGRGDGRAAEPCGGGALLLPAGDAGDPAGGPAGGSQTLRRADLDAGDRDHRRGRLRHRGIL